VREGNSDVRRRAWERLVEQYWKPVYTYVRARWAKSNEDAKDLTQDFFAWMLETDFPARADSGRGRFRVFVKTALENYLKDDYRARHREKREGSRRIVPIDPEGAAGHLIDVPDPAAGSPEELLERSWKDELLGAAVRLLGEAYRREGKEVYFRVFEAYYLSGDGSMRHEDLAAQYGLARSDVNNYLMDAKRRYREVLTALVAETVRSPEELREELRELFGSLFE
jgi:RNA polymerase sigma-70 factor (ECF subfamily)